MICDGLDEGGKGASWGDSGGPLVVNGARAGIVSSGSGCIPAGYPGVYANVHHLKNGSKIGAHISKEISYLKQGKIVGGKEISIEEAPYQISLEEDGHGFCGGSIASKNKIITAAHCVEDQLRSTNLQIRAGTNTLGSGGVVINVSKIEKHTNYSNLDYDIAVLTLEKDLIFDKTIKAISLTEKEPSDGEISTVSGWGSSDPIPPFPIRTKTLYAVEVPIVDKKKCMKLYENYQIKVTERMICAGLDEGGKDACKGDSGGPLVVNGTLAGVVSWGAGCAHRDYPGVYTDVNYLRKWINDRL